MRPGCDRPAAARVAFDPVALQLWLDPLARRSAPVQELCEFHVERLTIPRGWTATDRRPGSAAANGDVAAIAVLEPVPARLPRAESFEPDPVVEPDPIVEPEPALATASGPEPVSVVETEPIPTDVAPDPEPEPVVEAEPVPTAVAPEPEPEPEFEVVPEPEPVLDVEPEPVEPEPEPEVAPEPDPVIEVEATPGPEPEPEPATRPEPEPVAASARPRRPAARRPAARAGRSNAPSLLSRAFELTGHQESILTRAVPEADAEDPED